MSKYINDLEENMVLILTRRQASLNCKEENTPIKDITMDDIWPVLSIAMANAEVVILKEDAHFKVFKHKFMPGAVSEVYHISTLTNILFAR